VSKLVPIGLGAAAVIAVLFIGSRFIGPATTGGVGGAPSAEPTSIPSASPIGGTVAYRLDGAPATTEVDAVADGASVSGTAVTTISEGTYTVRLECAAQDGDSWAFGGTTEQTTVPGDRAGDWSAVIVKDGSPQQIGLWVSDDKVAGTDCDGWLASIDIAGHPQTWPVDSGSLVPPPDLAP
jgi:hypothetical protein